MPFDGTGYEGRIEALDKMDKVIDLLAGEAAMVIRAHGGDNAGHTVINSQGEFALHLVPAGIFNPGAVCVIAPGIAINPAGTLALVANYREGTVSVFTISGKTLTAAGKIDFGDPKAGPAAITFTPDGKTALVTRDGDHRISILAIDGSNVTDTKRVMTGGHRPYAVQVSPKGDIAVIGNQGVNAGDIMPVNVVDLKGKAPRIVNTVDVGQYIESLTFSNDGNYLAVIPQNGSNLAPSHPFYNDHGLLVVFAVNGTTLTKVAEAKIGQWPQGVVWSRDGKTLLAQSMVDKAIAVVSFDGKSLKVTDQINVTGGPDGIRTAGR